MRILWTLLKVIVGLAVAIPVAFLALALTAGLIGTVIALALIALKLAIIGGIAYGLFRLGRAIFAPSQKAPPPRPRELSAPIADPYYEAAVRELDAELGGRGRG